VELELSKLVTWLLLDIRRELTMRIHAIVPGLLLGGTLLGVGVARACGVDGVPSLSVNGRVVAINAALTSNARFDSWTPFVARGAYPAGHPLLLRENRANVAGSLPPAAFKYPWRWTFGDGATARGMDTRHAYRRPGAYILSVEAYLVAGAQRQWYSFDRVTIHVR